MRPEPTELLREDEERTVVDRRRSTADYPSTAVTVILDDEDPKRVEGARVSRHFERAWRRVSDGWRLLMPAILTGVVSGVGIAWFLGQQVVTRPENVHAHSNPSTAAEQPRPPSPPSGESRALAVSASSLAPRAVPPERDPVELERRAADLLIANQLEEALTHYRLLAASVPAKPIFSDFVWMLERKLGCHGDGAPRARSCD